jgi:hypothetical protein
MESCFTTEEDYTPCVVGHDDIDNSGITIGSGEGAVAISGTDENGYTLVGTSKGGDPNNTFTYTKEGATVTKSCTGDAGCNDSSW